jgi:hypothetical protein
MSALEFAVQMDFPGATLADLTECMPSVPPVEHCIVELPDGVYGRVNVPGAPLIAAIEKIFSSGSYFSELDYAALSGALFNPDATGQDSQQAMFRFAASIVPFARERRALYRSLKIENGVAQYYFEPVYVSDEDNPHVADVESALTVDEFLADIWSKGVRYGIDVEAVRAAIESDQVDMVVVAQQLAPVPGRDAEIVEASDGIRRSNAPRQLPNGRFDMMAFENRFPYVAKGVKLLKKVPRVPGKPGFSLGGSVIEPSMPRDLDLAALAGPGTVHDISAKGEFLVSLQAGFVDINSHTNLISVGDKTVSHDGVSARTTGNLQLTGDYEEYGEVQEKRVVEGTSITVHADVFGKIVSRGGTVLLNQNLVGGAAHNANGDITVRAVASRSVIQASNGEVVLQRAENCVIAGTRVRIEHAVNCEIIGEDVSVKLAEGCAIAGRTVRIGSAGPRKHNEMLIFALQADSSKIEEAIPLIREQAAVAAALAAERKLQMDTLTQVPEVVKYMKLATQLRKKELVLTPEQLPLYQKMVLAIGPALNTIARVAAELKSAETQRDTALADVELLLEQRRANACGRHVEVGELTGDTVVRVMTFDADGGNAHEWPLKDIKPRLRASGSGAKLIFSGAAGAVFWNSPAPD